MQEINIYVYRDLSNRLAGEPDDGPMAWAAHKERRLVIADTFADPAFKIEKNVDAEDETRTHELAEIIAKYTQSQQPI